MEKLPRLIMGQMNVPFIILKPNYAHGVNRPKRVLIKQVKPIITKLRKAEGVYF